MKKRINKIKKEKDEFDWDNVFKFGLLRDYMKKEGVGSDYKSNYFSKNKTILCLFFILVLVFIGLIFALSEYSYDFDGNIRGLDGTWDIGAYEFQSGVPCVPNCINKECGNNGCGGSCGTCVSPAICNATQKCQTIGPVCGDNVCSVGENCARDNSSCVNNICYNPTCTNGCSQTPVANGLTDTGCSGVNQNCNGAGSCITLVCSVGEKRCTGTGNKNYQICNALRTGWDLIDTCTASETCIVSTGCQVSTADSDSDGILNSNDYCPNTPVALRTNVNSNGCAHPLYEKFKLGTSPLHNITFNLSKIRNLTGVANLSLGIPGNGTIIFKDKNMNIEGANLDAGVNISQGGISIDSTALPMLNIGATLQFFNIGFIDPGVLKDGVVCSDCVENSYSNGVYVIGVNSFSTYEVVETYVTPVDPPSGGSPGGGGGGGGGAPCVVNWTCTSWSNCLGGEKTRACNDTKKCGTITGKPVEIESCSCEESWICDEWSECNSDTQKQTRNCREINNCGTILEKPLLEQECQVQTDLGGKVSMWKNLNYPMIIIVSSVVLLILLILSIIYFWKKSTRFSKTNQNKKIEEIKNKFENNEESEKELRQAKLFINKARAKGYSKDQIRELFVKKGWSNELIDKLEI